MPRSRAYSLTCVDGLTCARWRAPNHAQPTRLTRWATPASSPLSSRTSERGLASPPSPLSTCSSPPMRPTYGRRRAWHSARTTRLSVQPRTRRSAYPTWASPLPSTWETLRVQLAPSTRGASRRWAVGSHSPCVRSTTARVMIRAMIRVMIRGTARMASGAWILRAWRGARQDRGWHSVGLCFPPSV